MLLVILIVLLAVVGGFLGDLLEFALWAIAILAAIGALLGYLIYRWIAGVKRRAFDNR